MWIMPLAVLAILVTIIGYYLGKKDVTHIHLHNAETYIRNHTALYRHYNIRGVQDILKGKIGSQGRIADIDDNQVVEIVQRIRCEKGMGPIAYYNLPGYQDNE